MSQNVKGLVLAINTADGKSKAGRPYTKYTAVMSAGFTFDAGIRPPPFKAGETIDVELEEKFGKMQLVRDDDPSGGGGGRGRAPRPWPVPEDHGDNSIIRQNSLKHAVAVIVGSPVAQSGSVSAEVMAEEAIKIAYKFTEFSSGRLDAVRVAQATEPTAVDTIVN